jgi:transcription elongation factor GreA
MPRKLKEFQNEEPFHLTREGLRKLKDKHARLKSSLPALIEETARTAAYGDRSENAEYQMAKSALRRTHRQIWHIEDQLKRVQLIEEGPRMPGVVELGSTVVLEANGSAGSPQGGVQKTFEILGAHETNPDKGRISHLSPLGAGLMGRRKGEVVRITTARGAQEYKILEVR